MTHTVVFLGTGGTIAGTAASDTDNVGYKAAQVGIEQLLSTNAALRDALNGMAAESEQVLQVNSKDMVFADWQKILGRVVHHLQRPEVIGVLITHGTDTIEETAYFLNRAIPIHLLESKRIVLTCAMRPASSSSADGPANLRDATSVVVDPSFAGVVVVCAGFIHSALHVQKVHSYRLNPFDSGEAGPLGLVEEGNVRWVASLPAASHQKPRVNIARIMSAHCSRVEILVSHSGSSGAVVQALMTDALNSTDPLRGIVVAGTGNGDIHEVLERELKNAQAAGITVWRTSRCAYGQLVVGKAMDSPQLPEAFASPVKARIDMLLALLQ